MTFKDTMYGDLTGQAYHGDIKLENIELDSLEGCPNIVFGDFIIYNAGLTSLKGAPTKVSGRINISVNELTSLEFCPEMQDGRSFSCSDNKGLTSLKGGPTCIIDDYGIFGCSLTSFEYSPIKVLGMFNGSDNKVTSLKGCTPYVGGRFFINNNRIGTTMIEDGFRPQSYGKMRSFGDNPNMLLDVEFKILFDLKDDPNINDNDYLNAKMYQHTEKPIYLPPFVRDIFIF